MKLAISGISVLFVGLLVLLVCTKGPDLPEIQVGMVGCIEKASRMPVVLPVQELDPYTAEGDTQGRLGKGMTSRVSFDDGVRLAFLDVFA